ncbi:2-oxo-4-hydroxy-4-carboxy-5-ureidoimidazoline decarboxylase [Nocardia yunnanensis]|uniref:2-oxo-4-hydroxy-4-carboxy-5-ureidoimidazoline decarboxylase n=1 Tax=Nocardia yunnanensis TaxID=2382165 RepID=A0A386ZQ87_9NOCA|nr:2-oxo-4-hydroxy-4-carboxy-5-ureidoimidazoline decarboxylase [Nocardia yunnanensis]
MTLVEFNSTAGEELRPDLLTCCDAPTWADGVLADRPYADIDSLLARASELAAGLSGAEVDRALSAHPRIGDRVQGSDTHSAWSRQEQSGVSQDESVAAQLLEGNLAYEQRFGKVFLICATGLSAEQILASLNQRLTNDDETEAKVVAEELRKIAVLRLRKVFDA